MTYFSLITSNLNKLWYRGEKCVDNGTKEGLFAFSTYSCLVRVYSQLLVTLSWQQLELKVDSESDGIAGKQSIQAKETRGFP